MSTRHKLALWVFVSKTQQTLHCLASSHKRLFRCPSELKTWEGISSNSAASFSPVIFHFRKHCLKFYTLYLVFSALSICSHYVDIILTAFKGYLSILCFIGPLQIEHLRICQHSCKSVAKGPHCTLCQCTTDPHSLHYLMCHLPL